MRHKVSIGQEKHIEEIYSIFKYYFSTPRTNYVAYKKHLYQTISKPNTRAILALQEDDKLIGYADLEKKSQVKSHLHIIALDYEYTEQGYGTYFLDKIITGLYKKNYHSITLTQMNERNTNYYRNFGFQEISDDLLELDVRDYVDNKILREI